MQRLWCDPESSFEGEFWTLEPARAYPKPVQQPHPPIHVGGESDVALRRVVRLGADWLPFNVSPALLAQRRERLAELLEGTGRSVDDVFISASADRESARSRGALAPAYEEAGADQLLVHFRRNVTLDNLDTTLDEMAADYGVSG
jgi:alkanesulfonate monooxygenase SsuD/methylene tetrahydromethanopterin reductase-like flavin-dependent oxidoreductase (luciferase family)